MGLQKIDKFDITNFKGTRGYTILSIDSPSQLRLNRNYIGESASGKTYIIMDGLPHGWNIPCSITIPSPFTEGRISVINGSELVFGVGTNWDIELAGSKLKISGQSSEYTILDVDSRTQQLRLDRNYEGMTATEKDHYLIHPLFVDYSIPTNWQKRCHVVNYNDRNAYVEDTDIGSGIKYRIYEVFIPCPDTNEAQSFFPSLDNPIVYAHLGVTATDDKRHTLDDIRWVGGRWGGSDRFGNESHIAVKAGIFRVRRVRPDPPSMQAYDSDRVFTSPPNYHGHSFYTFRWRPAGEIQNPNVILPLRYHIFRALDDTLFKVDWSNRIRRPITLDASQLQFFPNAIIESRWDRQKRQQVADVLNHLNSLRHDAQGNVMAMNYYQGLSEDALRVLAGLPGNEIAFSQLTIQPLDPSERDQNDQTLLKWRDRIGPDTNPDHYNVPIRCPILSGHIGWSVDQSIFLPNSFFR